MTICFQRGTPSVSELIAVRRCLPQFRHAPLAEVRAAIGSTGFLPLGEMPTFEAMWLMEGARKAGLRVLAENGSYVRYIPYDRTADCAWLIENDTKA